MTHAETVRDHLPAKAAPSDAVRVQLANETSTIVDASRIEAAVRISLRDAAFESAEVSVAIVTDPAIHQLNRQFLQHDYPTDVLSFVLADDGTHLEGEIVVSADAAQTCAAEAGWSPADELLLYVIHGALHLAGHGDKSPAESVAMLAAEAEVLDELGIVRSSVDGRWKTADHAPEAPSS